MKIIPYSNLMQNQRQDQARRVPRDPDNRFSRSDGSVDATGVFSDAVRVVSMENRRALAAGDTVPDLNAAEKLLGDIRQTIGTLTRSDLRNIHGLEGLVHVYGR